MVINVIFSFKFEEFIILKVTDTFGRYLYPEMKCGVAYVHPNRRLVGCILPIILGRARMDKGDTVYFVLYK